MKKIATRLFIPFTIISFLTLTSIGRAPEKPETLWFKQWKEVESNTVLLCNEKGAIPLKGLTDRKFASIDLGVAYAGVFDSIVNKYTEVLPFSAAAYKLAPNLNELSSDLKFFDTVLLQLTDLALNDPKNRNFIADLARSKNVIAIVYGSPLSMNFLESFGCPIIWAPADSPVSSHFAAQLVFGGSAAKGKLLVDVSPRLKKGMGFSTEQTRLSYSVPEDAGINSADLYVPIDNIVSEAINRHVTPGAVVMVVKDGKVIFDKAYGSHTYSGEPRTSTGDIYDLASVTKISATTIAAMRLYEQNKLDLSEKTGTYIPLARQTNKNNLSVRELMLHEAGLAPYIPFHSSLKPGEFGRDSSWAHPVKVAENYYIRPRYYEDIMLPRMLNTGLRTRGKYEYSDLSMYFLKEVVERQAAEPLDQYVLKEFYQPLGMKTAGFKPSERFSKYRLVPTEKDTYFRKTLVQGYVHDQGAALAGGVAGHAGLFSSANDLAILFQMFLNGGTYGGAQYFKPETIDMFTSRQSDVSRRGLGFDRWDPDRSNRYPSELASPKTYGHTGFTGTCVWVDPQYNLVYIFLSNRLYEEPANKLSSQRVRPRIQDAIYEAIRKGSAIANARPGGVNN